MPDYDGTITLSTPVSDLDASLAWFADKLGLDERFKAPEAGWAEVGTPTEGVSIGLNQHGEGSGGGTTPVLGVQDIDAARAELEAKGVQFEGETEEIPGHGQARNLPRPRRQPLHVRAVAGGLIRRDPGAVSHATRPPWRANQYTRGRHCGKTLRRSA